jgi:hypothetical protein
MKEQRNVIVRLMGGLGNQMFQYAAGRALSHICGAKLLLDISGYASDLLRGFELNRFAVTAQTASSDELAAFSIYSSTKRRLSKLWPWRRPEIYREPNFCFDPQFFELKPPIYLDGYWQSEKYFLGIADILRQEFTLSEPLDTPNLDLLKRISAENAVSLHVRRGDYVSNPTTAAFHGVCSLEYYRKAVEYMVEIVEAPHFYLFSDDPNWVKMNLCLKHPCTLVDINQASNDGVKDMLLMRACAHHIIANSSFSWWGAWLGGNPSEVVIAPRQWFKVNKDGRDLLPPSWITI